MRVTKIFVDLATNGGNIVATATVYLDDSFAIHDFRVVRKEDGSLFVGMPSRVFTDRCPECGVRCDITSNYCNDCGGRLARRPAKFFTVAHPLNNEFRAYLCEEVLRATEEHLCAP